MAQLLLLTKLPARIFLLTGLAAGSQGHSLLPTIANPTQPNNPCHSLRVLALGDCNTWGITNPPIGNTILDKFCRHLESEGHTTTSQNLGYEMATTREGIPLMRRNATPADVVLINFGLVDTWVTSIPQIYIPYYPDSFSRKRLRKLLKFVKRRLRSPWLRRFVPTGQVVPIDEYAQNIRVMISLARAKNPLATILLWGSPPVRDDPLATPTWSATTSVWNVSPQRRIRCSSRQPP